LNTDSERPTGERSKTRSDSVDLIKASAIVAVIFTHAKLPPAHPQASLADAILCTNWVNFHVPAFLAVSGFLYHSTEPLSATTVARRLARLLVPYIVASAAFALLAPTPALARYSFLGLLVSGGAVGIYYYVFLATALTPLIWILSRLHRHQLTILFAASLLYPIAASSIPELTIASKGYWGLRNPLHFLGAFIAGWLTKEYLGDLKSVFRNYLVLTCVVAVVAATLFLAIDIVEPQFTYTLLLLNRRAYVLAGGLSIAFLASRNTETERIDWSASTRISVIGLTALGVLAMCTALTGPSAWFAWKQTALESLQLTRLLYTGAVVILLAALAESVFRFEYVGRCIRFLSGSSYGIYLYHVSMTAYLSGLLLDTHAWIRVPTTALLTLAVVASVALLVRRLLPKHGRTLVGI
jgi:fucose 4-O-acetylase-like acetyltransferase